jgi:hypothetical protein
MNSQNRLKKLTLAALFTLSVIQVRAQIPMSLYYMETIPQSNQLNPGMAPRANFYVSLPSVFAGFQNDVAFKDVLQKVNDHEWVTPLNNQFDYAKLYDKLGDALNTNLNGNIGIIGLGVRSGRDYFTFQFSEKVVMQSGLPSDLFKIGEIGLPNGTLYDFSTLRIKAYAYKEISLGYTREITDQITLGVHLKPLFGQVAAMTDIESFSLKIGREMYDVSMMSDVYTSMPMTVYSRPNEFPDSTEFNDMDASEAVSKYATSFKNPGLAVDLGGIYKLNEDWIFSAALNNLGFINWNEDLNSLHTTGTYHFEGINVTAENWDSLENTLDEIADDLEEVLDHQAGHDKFTTGLTPNVFLGASYRLNHAVTVGALSKSTFQKQNFRQEFALSANYNPYRFVSLNMSLNSRIKGSTYLGMALAWYMGPLQVYLATDHIPLFYSQFETEDGDKFPIPERLKDVNIMLGMNLVFGSKGFRDSPMIGKHK